MNARKNSPANVSLVVLALCTAAVGCQRDQPAEQFVPSRWIRIQVAEGQDASNAILTERDFNEIKAMLPTAVQAVPERNWTSGVTVGDKTRTVTVQATLIDVQHLLAEARVEIVDGRFFGFQNGQSIPAAIVISEPLANDLFPSDNAIGKTASIQNKEFEIIGVLGKPDVALHGVALADIYMELNPQLEPATIQPVPSGGSLPPTLPLDRAWIKVSDLSQVESATEIIANVLSRNHPAVTYDIQSETLRRPDPTN